MYFIFLGRGKHFFFGFVASEKVRGEGQDQRLINNGLLIPKQNILVPPT